MKMILQCLIPGMKDRDTSEFSSKTVFGVGAKLEQSVGNGLEEDIEEDFFVA
jgi:hypothetical protein